MAEDTFFVALYREAVSFPGPSVPLAALHTALLSVETELAHARDQATVQLRARHNRLADTLDPDDREYGLYELKVTVEQTLPRVFRGGYVLTLWSAFEVISKRMAEYVGAEQRTLVTSSQWRKKDRETFLDILERVYKRLGIPAFPEEQVRKELDLLREIRNALIHQNGNVAGLPKSIRDNAPAAYAEIGLDHFTELHEEFVIPNAEFLKRNFALVQTHLSALAIRAYEAAHTVSPVERGV
jgi:hypothetical protein